MYQSPNASTEVTQFLHELNDLLKTISFDRPITCLNHEAQLVSLMFQVVQHLPLNKTHFWLSLPRYFCESFKNNLIRISQGNKYFSPDNFLKIEAYSKVLQKFMPDFEVQANSHPRTPALSIQIPQTQLTTQPSPSPTACLFSSPSSQFSNTSPALRFQILDAQIKRAQALYAYCTCYTAELELSFIQCKEFCIEFEISSLFYSFQSLINLHISISKDGIDVSDHIDNKMPCRELLTLANRICGLSTNISSVYSISETTSNVMIQSLQNLAKFTNIKGLFELQEEIGSLLIKFLLIFQKPDVNASFLSLNLSCTL